MENMRYKLNQIHASYVRDWLHLYEMVRQQPFDKFVSEICPTALATHTRNLSWTPITGGDSVEGVTIPRPTHQLVSLTWQRI
jgi:hypothetical protein